MADAVLKVNDSKNLRKKEAKSYIFGFIMGSTRIYWLLLSLNT